MQKMNISEEINSIFHLLKENERECAMKDIFPNLPDRHFLLDLTLCGLELPGELSDNSIFFKGEMKTLPGFLKGAVCYEQIADIRRIDCGIVQDECGEIIFKVMYNSLEGTSIQMASLELELENFLFSGGTDAQNRFLPDFVYECLFSTDQGKVGLTVSQDPEEGRYSVCGDFSSDEERTIDQIFSLFHMTDIHIGDYLPEGFRAAVFDRLRLKSVFMEALPDSIQAFTAEVTTGDALALAADKITFTPTFCISVDNGLIPGVLNFYAYGEFFVGGSYYEIYVNPGLMEINFGLKKGSVLDTAAMARLFFDIELPGLRFDRLSASMGFDAGRYAFELGAADVLEFEVAEKKIAIDGILLRVMYEQGQFAVGFTGYFDICGVAFQTSGSYGGGKNYSFSCCITRDIHIPLSDLFRDFFGDSCLLSDSFDFTISWLIFDCVLQKNSSFRFAVSMEFSGSDEALKKLFSLRTDGEVKAVREEGRWQYAIDIGCGLEISDSQMLNCSYRYDSTLPKHENLISLSYQPKTQSDVVTLKDILNAVGFADIDDSWRFITQVGISYAQLSYDFERKRFAGEARISTGGGVKIWIDCGEKAGYGIAVDLSLDLSFAGLPVVGGLTDRFGIRKEDFGVKDITVYALTSPDEEKKVPAGVRMDFTVFGSRYQWQIYKAEQKERGGAEAGNVLAKRSAPEEEKAPYRVVWLKAEKSLAIFSLHRIGLGLDGSYLMFMLDASLNVAPLQFDLFGAGAGVSISDPGIRFYLSGFGISYTSPALTIGGALMRTGDTYAGQLIVQTKPFSLSTAAEYRSGGYLFAYALIAANMGGPPAFYIKGLALGFGYNKRLMLPDIDRVPDYPLVKAACGRTDLNGMLAELDQYIADENGQRFLAFGLKFSTFEIAESFVLLTVTFGNRLEIGLLGISDITMPPKCGRGVQPIAHAQLALKAQIKPEEGFLGIEARLTSESYIFSRDCRLTGGFAFFMWFGGEHAGDFVITLGGYHPKYEQSKPAHYPDVPRVGFQWNIGKHVNITGEAYFALTPAAIMAGGRLSMTYTLGNLKAYFIAKADFLISWKPFHYDIELGITLGASYHLKVWFISRTITLELGTDLHIWGPDFSAVARVSIWIISFTVKIGADAQQSVPDLSWQEFCGSFLPGGSRDENRKKRVSGRNTDFGEESENDILRSGEENADAAPLKIVFGKGLTGKVSVDGKETQTVSGNGVMISAETAIPVATASLNGGGVSFAPVNVSVKPMGKGGSTLKTDFSVTVLDQYGKSAAFKAAVILRNMPTALWGGEGELKENVPCGLEIASQEPVITLFPKKNDISLEDLYRKGTEKIENAFVYMEPGSFPDYTREDTIELFRKTADSAGVREKRKQFLQDLGVELTEEISLAGYAAGADDYLDEEVLAAVYE